MNFTDKQLTLFFRLLRLGLGTDEVPEAFQEVFQEGFSPEEKRELWGRIYRLGVRQGVGVIVFDGLQRMVKAGVVPEGMRPPRSLINRWMSDSVQLEKHCAKQYRASAELAEVYGENGIRTVVLKGIAAGACYPVPEHRPCGDLDCFLMGDYDRGNAVAEAAGAKVTPDFYKHSHIKYKGLEVENHQFCTAIRGSRRAKDFERLLQELLQEGPCKNIGETRLECPSPMFNALFLTHHSLRHYLSEGIALRHLCDWAMFLKVQGNQVDWKEFRLCADKYGLSAFADATTKISAGFLGVELPEGYAMPSEGVNEHILLGDILNYKKAHDYGNKWKARASIVKSVLSNRHRYRYFSDTSMLKDFLKLISGFIFDQNPKI